MPDILQALSAAVARLLRPLVRILQRNGVPYHVFAELAKQAYVEVALEQFAIPGRKQSISRVSILTGLTRKEVSRVQNLPPIDDCSLERYNRAARVIAGWVRDREFTDREGRPAVLPLQGEFGSFAALVRRYSGDMPARAMLDELLRVGAVAPGGPEGIRLVSHAYVPRSGEEEKIGILGTDVAELIATIEHNLYARNGQLYFQRKVAYDNLPEEHVPMLRTLSAERAQALLEELDWVYARADRDAHPGISGSGRVRAGLGIYYFEEPYREGH